jgi:hypothetical protein
MKASRREESKHSGVCQAKERMSKEQLRARAWAGVVPQFGQR